MTTAVPDLELWLLEALLAARALNEIEVQHLLRLPESFPFIFRTTLTDLRKYEGFDIHRQGLNVDMVAIRKSNERHLPKRATGPKTAKAAAGVQLHIFS
jgi:hypothetical protein